MSDVYQEGVPGAMRDTGLVCSVMLARYHNLAASPEQLAHEFGTNEQQSSSPLSMLQVVVQSD